MTTDLVKQGMAMSLTVPVGDFDAYIRAAHNVPMLTAEEEIDLATRLQENNDLDAAKRLVMSHLRFVIRIAKGYTGYGLPVADLVQEGSLGLMKAVKRFDPSHGVRLVSFAVHWIRAEIHEYVIRNWRIVKVATTKSQRKLFFNLRKAKKRLGWLNQNEVNAVAKDLGVEPGMVMEMESRLSGLDLAFDGHQDSSEDDSKDISLLPSTYIESHHADPANQIACQDYETQSEHKLHNALMTLDDRSQDILNRRWLSDQKATLQELAEEHGVSAERIRQLENNAMKKLKATLVA